MAEKKKIPVRSTTSPLNKTVKAPAAKPGGSKPKGDSGDKKKAKDPYAAAQAKADKKEKAAKKAAGNKYLEQAGNLEAQAKAIRQALDIDFASARDNNLGDISRALGDQITALQTGHAQRAKLFLDSAKDTEVATASTQEESFSNAVRERADTLTNILTQGAGETDTLRGMLMAAKNWNANAGEANRAYFDSMRSVNQGIVDLNVDTKGQMANAFSTSESERDRIWSDFYNRRAEAFTQLGNIKGQQKDYYASAKEMGVKPKKGTEKAAQDAMEKAFKDSAVESGKGYTQAALPNWISDYQGQDQLKAEQSNSNLAAAVTFDPVAKAEGATLRKWAS